MSQLQKKFLANNAVDESKIRLSNNAPLKARNAADSADVDIVKVNSSDKIEFASVPQATADASAGNDLVRFSQFSGALDGLKPKAAVAAASTGNIDLSVASDPSPVDGYTLVDGDRILLWKQTAAAENGIYIANTAIDPTSWTRSLDFDAPSEIPGAYTVSEFGTLYQGVLFVSTSSPGTIGTDPINFAMRVISVNTYTGGDMIALSGSAFSVDLASTSGLQSTNPGNAAGQLEIKLEASNPSLQIDGSNQLGVKLDAAGAIVTGASGIKSQVLSTGGIQISSNSLAAKLADASLASSASGLSVQEDAAGAIITSGSGIKVNLETSNPSLQISTNELGVKFDPAGALASGASGVAAQVDGSTVKINGSNQLESLQPIEERLTLNGTDITNQYVDLANPIFGSSSSANSASLFVVGGPMQLKTVDYTVSLTGGSGGVTRISFAGDLATGGNAALVSGDILVIGYEYLA